MGFHNQREKQLASSITLSIRTQYTDVQDEMKENKFMDI